MTHELKVALAIKALIQAALPTANVRGFDADSELPERIGPGGCVIGTRADPGEPEIDLSPLTYNYRHRFELEIAAENGAGGAPLDTMLLAIGAVVAADPYLGGLCNYFSCEAAEYLDASTDTIPSTNWALVPLIAEYATPNPLG